MCTSYVPDSYFPFDQRVRKNLSVDFLFERQMFAKKIVVVTANEFAVTTGRLTCVSYLVCSPACATTRVTSVRLPIGPALSQNRSAFQSA
ncbi:MAG: hypothetical protein Athens041674_624 [Parcubacteria group bacterium Athens0416_74]|nr:MAG: hypothetical protein Athens041674_624 [Parcubacteria group bacterium Athens0416_74]